MGTVDRTELLDKLSTAGREMSAATVMYHATLAARQGLSATEEKTIDLLERLGPLTPGELGRQSGLAPASVTGLIDRLERKGFARRAAHPSDGRRVLVELDRERTFAGLAPLFADWFSSLQEMYEGFTDAELATILRFMTEAAHRQREATAKLTTEGTPGT